MKKKIIVGLVLVLAAAVLFGFTMQTTIFDARMLENDNESRVTIQLKHRRMDWLVKKVKGSIQIKTENDLLLYEDRINGRLNIIPNEDLCYISFSVYDPSANRGTSAELYVDGKQNNLIYKPDYDGTEVIFYTADEAFIALVEDFSSK